MTPSGALGRRTLTPYLAIGLLTLFCHGFILTNDGTIWDSWYLLNFLQNRNWSTMHEFFSAVGMPLYDWLYRPFAFAPNIVGAFMAATFLCLLANGVLIFQLALRLGRLTRGEALALALLAQAMPLFSAAQDFIMFFFILMQTIFLASALLAVAALDVPGRRGVIVRVAAVLGFLVSFSNAALLVFYGCFYPLLFFRHWRLEPQPLLPAARRFVTRYPDFLLLPPASWLVRTWLTPQYGKYELYNNPAANLPELLPNFLSFFRNTLPYHARDLAAWPASHPLTAMLMVAGVALVVWLGPERWQARRGSVSTARLVAFGAASLALAILPFAAAGKEFPAIPLGEVSRHCILAGLPLAVLALALLRKLFLGRPRSRRWFAPIAGALACVLASRVTPVYVLERAEWVYSSAVLHAAVRNETVRESSAVVLRGFSVIRQDAYALFGFSTAFGSLTRFVTHRGPKNRKYFTPVEMGRILWRTTVTPGNFNRIVPGGQQIVLEARRNPGMGSPWQIVSRYLLLRSLGAPGELDNYLASLITVKTVPLKPATPFTPSAPPPAADPPPANVPAADFTNGSGMRMVRVPGGWWADALETTQDTYQRLMERNPSLFKDPARPVENVSWLEAMEFCRRLTARESAAGRLPSGFVYRLPTAGEFDAVAGTLSDDAVTSVRETRWYTEPAGRRPPNQFGLHDAFGNVWEWCLDWADEAHHFKVSKGGSWVNDAEDLPSAAGAADDARSADPLDRLWRKDFPDQGFVHRGFRAVLARAVEQPVFVAPR